MQMYVSLANFMSITNEYVMGKIKYYQVDAFTNRLFGGNPAGVCPLDEWIDDSLMQKIAMENNLSETVFFVERDNYYEIRWFTPKVEIDLAGHPTLATAFVIFNMLNFSGDKILFKTKLSDELRVKRNGDLIEMNFPSRKPEKIALIPELEKALKAKPVELLQSRDMIAVLDSEHELLAIDPDYSMIKSISHQGVAITAKGEKADFVSRFFAPAMGINEDPVTGSAHCSLIPYWAEKLNKTELLAYQLSERKGELFCRYLDDRVEICGQAVLFMEGEIMT